MVVSNARENEPGLGGSGTCTCANAGEVAIRQNTVAPQAVATRILNNESPGEA